MRFRKTGKDDIPQLKQLWLLSFDDTPQDAEDFFRTLYPQALGFAAEEDGVLQASVFALSQTIVAAERSVRAAYLYAVNTRPEARGKGLCRALLAYAEKELKKRCIACLLLCPASAALAQSYARMGFAPQRTAQIQDLPAPRPRGKADPITPAEYAGLRETLLYDVPHVRYSLPELRLQTAEGGFYALTLDGRYGCAAVRMCAGKTYVDEILPDAGLLPALAQALPQKALHVRGPGGRDCYAMARWLDEAERLPEVYAAFGLE